jgi:outer membrane receptor protein involved in Fe transport
MSGEINLKKGGLPDYPLQRLFVSNTMLDSYFKHAYRSKYAADYLRQQITGGIDLLLPFDLRNSWVMNYKKRVGDSGFVLVDAKLSREVLKAGTLKAEAFISGTNLFDVKYSEQSDIDMPRRWIKAGARAEF